MGLLDHLRGARGPRVAFVGIDGVPHDLVRENPGRFPNLHRIAEAGSAAAIDSIVPPEESACWPALTTGKNPGETGVYGFQDRETGTYETYAPMGRDVQATRLWDRVAEADRDATVLNVPVTFPPQQTVQRMVSGFLAPGVEKAAYPEDVARYLDDIDYRIDVNAKLGHREDKTKFVENAHATLDARYEAFEHYLRADDWDLFVGVFMAPDRVNHFLYGDYVNEGEYAEAFLDFYEKLDRYLGSLHDLLPDDVAFVVASDHGFTELDYEVHTNAWLESEGWLSFGTDDYDSLGDIASDTKAYSFIPGRFYLNLEGREPRGCVPQEDYHEVRAELAEKLESLSAPDGNPVVERVVEKEAAFNGAHDDIAPDLVAIPHDGFDLKAGFRGEHDVFEQGHRTGMHTFSNATFVTDEPGLHTDAVDLYDLAPTLLDLLDVAYETSEFDGKSLL